MTSARSARIGSRSSTRHVQTSHIACRFTVIDSETPRSSSSSAMRAAVPGRRAAIDGLRDEVRQPHVGGGIELAARADRRMDGDGGGRRRMLRDDDGAVREHRAGGSQAALDRGRHSAAGTGSKRPIVRFTGARRFAAAANHLFQSHRLNPLAQRFGRPPAADRLEVPQLVGDVGNAVVFEDEARAQLPGGPLHLGIGHVVQSSRDRVRQARLPRVDRATFRRSP